MIPPDEKKKNMKKMNLIKNQMFLTKRYVDIKDPIYDSEEEDENCFFTVMNKEEIEYSQKLCELKKRESEITIMDFEEFSRVSAILIDNFFLDQNVQEMMEKIKHLEIRHYNDYLILQLISRSFDRDEICQTNVSCLLNILNITKMITKEQIYRVFEKILSVLKDKELDTPLCYEIFLNYIRFSVLDNVIDETYVYKLPLSFIEYFKFSDYKEEQLRLSGSEKMKGDESDLNAEIVEQIADDGINVKCSDNMSDITDSRRSKRQEKNETLLWMYNYNIVQIEMEKREYIKKCEQIIEEFFVYANIEKIKEFLSTTNSLYHNDFIRTSILLSFNQDYICRKMISYLLDLLLGTYLDEQDVIIAFMRLIGNIEETIVHCPQAKELLCKYLLRSIYDDVLYPEFLNHSYRLHLGGYTGMAICKKTQQRINIERKKVNFNNNNYIWEDDTYEQTKIKKKINNTLLEYFYAHIQEEKECLEHFSEFINDPTFSNYIVKKMFILNLDVHHDTSLSIKLIECLFKNKIITKDNITQGIKDIMGYIDDIILDIPKFPIEFEKALNILLTNKYISESFFEEIVKDVKKYIQ